MEKIYNYFEKIIITILLILMGLVVIVATIDLAIIIIKGLVTSIKIGGDAHYLGETIIETFSFFMLVLIAIEFFDAIKKYLEKHVLSAEVILLVALTAIAKKVIILDFTAYDPLVYMSIGFIIICLAAGYYLLKNAENTNILKTRKDLKEKEPNT